MTGRASRGSGGTGARASGRVWLGVAAVGFAVAGSLGCAPDDFVDFMDEDVPTFVCETDGAGSDCRAGDACSDSQTCAIGTVCAADVVAGERMPLSCTQDCVAPQDQGRWCTDDASCCDAGTVCTVRGYCVPAE